MATLNGPKHTTHSYKLRASGLVPISPGDFIIQTFGVDKNKITMYEATTGVPETLDFTGANPYGEYINASFQRLPYLTEGGDQIFNGQTVDRTEFVDEDEMPGGV